MTEALSEDAPTTDAQSALSGIEKKIEARARRCRIEAFSNTLLTIASLAVCLLLFVGADRLSEVIFTSQVEKEAGAKLVLAQAQLTTALADLAPAAAEVIHSLPDKIRPVIEDIVEDWLSFLSGRGRRYPEMPALPPVAPSPNMVPLIPNPNLGSEPSTITPTPDVRSTGPKSDAPTPIRPGGDARASNQLDEVIALRKEMIRVLRDRATDLEALSRANAEDVFSRTEIAREEASSRREIVGTEAYNREDVARTESNGREEVARIEFNAKKDIAAEQANSSRANEREKTARVEEWRKLGTTALTRIGSLFLLVWLVRIFNANRQRSSELAEFYQAVADQISVFSLSGTKDFRALLELQLHPPKQQKVSLAVDPLRDALGVAQEILKART